MEHVHAAGERPTKRRYSEVAQTSQGFRNTNSTSPPLRPIRSCAQCRLRKVRCDQQRPCRVCVRRDEADLCRDVGDQDHSDATTAPLITSTLTPARTEDVNVNAASPLWDQESVASTAPGRIVHECVIRPVLEHQRTQPREASDLQPISAAELTQSVNTPLNHALRITC